MHQKQSGALLGVTWRAMWRRWLSAVLLIAVAALGAYGVMALENLTVRQEVALEHTIANTTLSGIVTTATGTGSTNLGMFSSFVDMLCGMREERGCYLGDYVTNVRALSEHELERPQGYVLRRVLSLDSDPALDPVGGASVQFYDGWTEEALRGRERVCLVPAGMESEDGTFALVSAAYGRRQLEIIGTVSGGSGNAVYCPFYMAWDDNMSYTFPTDSCSFDILDNHKLEESKAEIYNWFVEPGFGERADGLTFGVIIQDDTYQKTLDKISDNLSMLRLLQPILLVVCGGIGFFVSYLATRGRTKEFAVMRCIGMGRGQIFALVMFELATMSVLGAVSGMLLGVMIENGLSAGAALKTALMTGIFLLGSSIAALRISGVNAMILMKVED